MSWVIKHLYHTLGGGQSKLSAPRCCGPLDEVWPLGNRSLGGPQHLGTDSFDCLTERYEIVVQ